MKKRTVTHDVWVCEDHSQWEGDERYDYRVITQKYHKAYPSYLKATLTIELPEREKMLKESEVKQRMTHSYITSCEITPDFDSITNAIFDENPVPAKQEPTVTRREIWAAFRDEYAGSYAQYEQLARTVDKLFGEK